MRRHSNARRVKGAQGSNKSEAGYVELDDGSNQNLLINSAILVIYYVQEGSKGSF